jgi:hypothetical protein
VTSDTLLGRALNQKPNVILGGQSWQVLSGTKSENVVYVSCSYLFRPHFTYNLPTPAVAPQPKLNSHCYLDLYLNPLPCHTTRQWPFLNLRMAGTADLSPLDDNFKVGYKLRISGLQFRWGLGKGDVPEMRGLMGDDQKLQKEKQKQEKKKSEGEVVGKSWTVVALKDDVNLANGVGTLEV